MWACDIEHGYGLQAIKRMTSMPSRRAAITVVCMVCRRASTLRCYPSCVQPCRPQDDATGRSALMAAAAAGATEAVEALLQAGAPWNAIDRRGRCAGDYAMEGDHGDAAGAILEAG